MSDYNYFRVFKLRHVHLQIAQYMPITNIFSLVCCNKYFNDAWKSQEFDAQLRNNFDAEYGENTLSFLKINWPIYQNDSNVLNNQPTKHQQIVIEPISNLPIPIHSDTIKPIDTIKGMKIYNNRQMVKSMLTNWIFVNQHNPYCPGGIVCGSRFADINIDFLHATCNANFVYYWASRVCISFAFCYIYPTIN